MRLLAILAVAVGLVGCGQPTRRTGISDAESVGLTRMVHEIDSLRSVSHTLCALDTVVTYPIHVRVPKGINVAFVDAFDVSSDGSHFRIVVTGTCPR